MSNTQHSAAELLPQLLNDEGVLNGEGSIAFIKPDRTTARIFLRGGNIYAVDNLDYENNLWSELRVEEHISHGNLRALIRAHKSQRESLYKLLRRTRNKLKNEDSLVLTLQEYLLGAVDNIYSWETVKVEWRMGDTFAYDGADVPEFSLSHLLTLLVNRSLFKFNKYEEWGFKNDDQFLFGNVRLEGDLNKIEPASLLEETILRAGQFAVNGLIDSTGYSPYSVASALDDLSKKLTLHIENPAGRQKPFNLPSIPHDVPVIKDKIHFSVTDEDPDMLKTFNTEYHVPEPALLEDNQETFNSEHKIIEEDFANETWKSYDDVINDTSSIEIVGKDLPPLNKEKSESITGNRRQIPQEQLDREARADDMQFFKGPAKEVPKARGTVKKPIAQNKTSITVENEESESVLPSIIEEPNEIKMSIKPVEPVTDETISTPSQDSEGNEMSSESPLFALLEQLDSQLSNQKNKIEEHKLNISEKEISLQAAKNEVNRLTMELANEIGAKETATSEYEQARQILNSLNQ